VVAFVVLFALLMMNTELRSFVVGLVYFFGVVLFCAKTVAVVASSRMHTPMAAIFAKLVIFFLSFYFFPILEGFMKLI
jgi:hypothetical protein